MPRCPTLRATGLPPAVLLLAGLLAGCGAPRPTEPPAAGPGYRGGIVAVANPHAAEAGARILERGGNAVDAAVAIAYALNVVEPQSAGIGGGGFMMVHLAQQDRTLVIDSRETAPAGATRDMFVGVPDPSLQGVAVGVPGMVRGTAHALRQHGRLGLAEVLQPAIELADEGFVATPRYAAVSCTARSRNSPEAAAVFCPGGTAPVAGTRVQNRPLAETLRLIARHGPDCFYRLMPELGCDIARGIVEGQRFARPGAAGGVALPGKGGSMTYVDLEAYAPVERAPLEGRYRGYRLKTAAPPSSGGAAVIQMLKMVERFPLGDTRQGFGFGSPNTVNVMVDAMRLAFADRAVWQGDADFVPVPSRGLIADAYTAARGAALRPGTRLVPDPAAGDPRPHDTASAAAGPAGAPLAVAAPVTGPGESTTHFVVADRWGNLVSYTNTIESPHGIGVFAGYRRPDGSFKSHGFLLNNELTDFNLAPSTHPYTGGPGFNDVMPGRRPRSSMAPSMLFTAGGRPFVAYGSPGGATIINSVFNVTLNLVDHRMPLQAAIDAPRVSVTSAGGPVARDHGVAPAAPLPAATLDALAALGYTLAAPADIGSVQAVLVDPRTGLLHGAADRRREGTVIGLPR